MDSFSVSGNIIDIINNEIYPGTVTVAKGKIKGIERQEDAKYGQYIMPGFIDAHVHIESSMLVPSEFARMAVVHGTVSTVSDPHEIANVLGLEGVRFMMENGARVPFKFYFGAPSCVPATGFETSGGAITSKDIKALLADKIIKYLSEMMNYPGVLFGDAEVIKKLEYAREAGKPVDGHAPGLRGSDAEKYVAAGITTDHECFSIEEAREKISYGMRILIREGSAAKNFEALHPLISEFPDMVMLCSDDKHPGDLAAGHINLLVKRAQDSGHSLINVLKCAILNPMFHYGLDTGLLREGDPADFIVVDNPRELNILKTYINGTLVAEDGRSRIESVEVVPVNNFNIGQKDPSDFVVMAEGMMIRVIEAIDNEIITKEHMAYPKTEDGFVVADTENDILKIAVVNRYEESKPAIGFIKNFGLKRGAIATSVAHDSHNIIAVGTNDRDISAAVNEVIRNRGGMAAADSEGILSLSLPVAGLMSSEDAIKVAHNYELVEKKAKAMGSTLSSPFMTLSFMALLVIPKLKLSDKGLFDGEKFGFTNLFV